MAFLQPKYRCLSLDVFKNTSSRRILLFCHIHSVTGDSDHCNGDINHQVLSQFKAHWLQDTKKWRLIIMNLVLALTTVWRDLPGGLPGTSGRLSHCHEICSTLCRVVLYVKSRVVCEELCQVLMWKAKVLGLKELRGSAADGVLCWAS